MTANIPTTARAHGDQEMLAVSGWREPLALVVLAAVCLVTFGLVARHGPALADEFIYLASAQHFARSGDLNARFYDADAILRQGYPHQDNHAPGYVLVLGSLIAVAKGTYWTAVGLNVVAYVLAALLTRDLALGLGIEHRRASIAGALFLVLPAYLAYVYWAMAEVILGALFLATLVCAVRFGDRMRGAAVTGLLFGLVFLVRESALFGLPALLALFRGRGRIRVFLVAAAAFALLVYAPLSAHRSEGASNFWKPTVGKEFGYQGASALRAGNVVRFAEFAVARASMNIGELAAPATSAVEKAMLALFVLLPLAALGRWRGLTNQQRRFLLGLVVGYAALLAVMLSVYVIVRWAGFRYLMFLMPSFLPFIVGASGRPAAGRTEWVLPGALAVLCVVLVGAILGVLNPYKASRQRRQEGIAEYVERYVDARRASRVVVPNGWLFGLRNSVEVISSLPDRGVDLRKLESAVWFDYLVLPGDSALVGEWDNRVRYRRLNADAPTPPLAVYRRLR